MIPKDPPGSAGQPGRLDSNKFYPDPLGSVPATYFADR